MAASGPPRRSSPGPRPWRCAAAGIVAVGTSGRGGGPPRAEDRGPGCGGAPGAPRLQRRPHPPRRGRSVPGRVDLIEDQTLEAVQAPHQGLRARRSQVALGPRPRVALRLVPRRPAHEGAARRGGGRPARLHGVLRRPQRLGQLEGARPGRHHEGHEGSRERRDRPRPDDRRAHGRAQGGGHGAREGEDPGARRRGPLRAPAPRALACSTRRASRRCRTPAPISAPTSSATSRCSSGPCARGSSRCAIAAAVQMKPGRRARRRSPRRGGACGRCTTTRLLRFGRIKGYVDGVIEAHTAAMLEPYADDPSFGLGLPNWTPAGPERGGGGRRPGGPPGLPPRHRRPRRAHGPRRPRGRRSRPTAAATAAGRIEHIETIAPADYPRFKALGVIASMQPLHANPDQNNVDVWSRNVGPDRASRGFSWGNLERAGGPARLRQRLAGGDLRRLPRALLRGDAQDPRGHARRAAGSPSRR